MRLTPEMTAVQPSPCRDRVSHVAVEIRCTFGAYVREDGGMQSLTTCRVSRCRLSASRAWIARMWEGGRVRRSGGLAILPESLPKVLSAARRRRTCDGSREESRPSRGIHLQTWRHAQKHARTQEQRRETMAVLSPHHTWVHSTEDR